MRQNAVLAQHGLAALCGRSRNGRRPRPETAAGKIVSACFRAAVRHIAKRKRADRDKIRQNAGAIRIMVRAGRLPRPARAGPRRRHPSGSARPFSHHRRRTLAGSVTLAGDVPLAGDAVRRMQPFHPPRSYAHPCRRIATGETMNGTGIAPPLCGPALRVPRPAFAEAGAARELRLRRAQADAPKRLACCDWPAPEPCRTETDGRNRPACYDAPAERASPHRQRRTQPWRSRPWKSTPSS